MSLPFGGSVVCASLQLHELLYMSPALHNTLPTLFVGFITMFIFIAVTFFQDKLFKLFVILECKYYTMQFGIRISSIEVAKKSYASLYAATKLTAKKSVHERLFCQGRDSERFPFKQWCLCSLFQQKILEGAVNTWKDAS